MLVRTRCAIFAWALSCGVVACALDGPSAPHAVASASHASLMERSDTAQAGAARRLSASLRSAYRNADTSAPPQRQRAAPLASIVARTSIQYPPWGVAVNRAGLVIVTSPHGRVVTLLDATTYRVVATRHFGHRPNPVVFNIAGDKAFVGDQGLVSRVYVFDVSTRRVVDSVMTGSRQPFSEVLSVDGSRLFVGTNDGAVLEIDVAALQVTRTLVIGGIINGVAVDSTGTRLYASNADPVVGSLSEIDLATFQVLRTFVPDPLGAVLQGVVVSRDGSRAVVANETGPLFDFDLTSGTWTATPIYDGSFGLADAPAAQQVFIANANGAVDRYSIRTRTLGQPFPLAAELRRAAFHAPTRTLVVTDHSGASVVFFRQ